MVTADHIREVLLASVRRLGVLVLLLPATSFNRENVRLKRRNKMKKILNFIGSRKFNKVIIVADFIACAVNVCCGCFWFAVLWFLLATSWMVIDGYQKRLKRVCETAEKNDKATLVYIKSLNLERTKVLYYLTLYSKEKLTSDFCRGRWNLKDTKEYLERLRNAEDSIEALSELIHKKINEQQENDGKDNKTETEGAE